MISEDDLLSKIPDQLFIGGQWRDAENGARLDVSDPASGKILKSISDASIEDAKAAFDAAVSVQAEWARTAPRTRSDILRRTFDLLQHRKDEVALLITLEMGKPLDEAHGEVAYGGEFLRWYSEEAVRAFGTYGSNPEGTGQMIVTHLPVGPCYMITPWNFPLAMATRKLAPAIAAGCTSVIKPAELTPLTTLFLAKLMEEAGLPKGVVNVITTSKSAEVSRSIIVDKRLRKLSFTGSTSVGVALLKQAADGVLRTSMELGGNAAFIVFEDANLDAALEGAMAAKFRNTGQACTAVNRFIVHHSIADAFARKIAERVSQLRVGRGTEEGVTIGPLINEQAVSKINALVNDAIDKNAKLVAGGFRIDGPGSFFAPTVLTNVKPDSEIFGSEIFGPVVTIIPFRDEKEAVALANGTDLGLVSYVFTQDMKRGQRLIQTIETGMMGLNTGLVSNAAAPFGGMKQSGLGREGGAAGIFEYLESKYVLAPQPFA